MPGRLAYTVHVRDEQRRTHVFGPGDEVPEWAARLITNRAAWAERPRFDDEPDPGAYAGYDQGGGGAPAASATKDVWLAFAVARGVEIPAGATKAQIIDAVTGAAAAPGDGTQP